MRHSRLWIPGIAVLAAVLAVAPAARRLPAAVSGQDLWVGVYILDHNAEEGNTYYMGKLDRKTFDTLVAGDFKGFVKLESTCFHSGDDEHVEAFDKSGIVKNTIYLDSRHLYRVDLLTDAYVANKVRPALGE